MYLHRLLYKVEVRDISYLWIEAVSPNLNFDVRSSPSTLKTDTFRFLLA